MAAFKITRITQPVSFWDNFIQSNEGTGLSQDVFDEVDRNSNSILKLLNTAKSILVFGQVQSGKTLNYSGLIAKSFDTNIQLIVVVAGTKTNLVDQTYDRLRGYFKDKSEVDILKMSSEINLSNELDRLHNYSDRRLILVTLKHQLYLQKISTALHHLLIPTYIIDDEADQASLNTKEYYSHRNNLQEMSKIYAVISKMISSQQIKLIQYTATPQALFLLSKDNALSPEYYFVQNPPENYFGINELLTSSKRHMIIVRDFDSSYKIVLDRFIKNCYLLITNDSYDKNISCLIHSDWKTSVLREHYKEVVKFINGYTFNTEEWLNLECGSITIEEFEHWFKGHLAIHDVFQTKTVIDWEKSMFNILIGGNMLERGFTIPGLISTLLVRNNKSRSQSDTLQQRCRFLGYRGAILPYLKVYTTSEILSDLDDYDKSQNVLLDEISEYGRTVEFSRTFVMKYLTPTRQAVLPSTLRRTLASETFIITRKVQDYSILDLSVLERIEDRATLLHVPTVELLPLFEKLDLSLNIFDDENIYIKSFGSREVPRKRAFKNGKVKQLFQGRNNSYPGDRYLFTERHLQIHFVEDKSSGQRYVFLALINGLDQQELVYLDGEL
jgi:hypothetical protein